MDKIYKIQVADNKVNLLKMEKCELVGPQTVSL